jgi:hypothetical protein
MLFREETTAEVMLVMRSYTSALHTYFVFGGKLPLPRYGTEDLSHVNELSCILFRVLCCDISLLSSSFSIVRCSVSESLSC